MRLALRDKLKVNWIALFHAESYCLSYFVSVSILSTKIFEIFAGSAHSNSCVGFGLFSVCIKTTWGMN